MEALAAASSVTALIQITASVIRITTQIIQEFQDAPGELQQISIQLKMIKSELVFISSLDESSSREDLALLPNESDDLRNVLQNTQMLMTEIQETCSKAGLKSKMRARFSWVFHEKENVRHLLDRLQDARAGLQTILLIVNIRIVNLSRHAIRTASHLAITSNVGLLQDVASIRENVERTAKQGKPQENIVLKGLATRSPHDRINFWGSLVYLENAWRTFLGAEAALSAYGNDYQTTYDFSSRQSVFGLWLLSLEFRIRRFPLAGLGLQFVAGSLTVKNIVPETSPIMTACKKGEVAVVRNLFESRKASPNDITPINSTPLRFAIESGSVELVQTILSTGADTNAPFGQMITHPLSWAFASRQIEIARLLIEKGAQVDHVSARGWTAVFYLFGYDWIHGNKGESCIKYLNLLSAASFSEFDVQDADGWSVMHRAASWGTAQDIEALVNRGASVLLPTVMDWLPIRCATRFENIDTFKVLLVNIQDKSVINQRDKRGWTLLHDAADIGSSKLLELLLSNGADPHIVTFELASGVPHDLKNRTLTAGDIAKQRGRDVYDAYKTALGNAEMGISIVEELDDSGSEDIFWVAESGAV
ncbi:hypothetical protein HYFRA_00002263 [Hymenoscyphus fraxineus]|uniref:Ankyrin n=1 Tax=Hymenoscyphus fraxineus TaxID=746836 RepID=A0A9N9Q0G6_9HELO|nr:hypothetical protein HYFRA_00002263 [Hymenoscyphus fraxineus]